MVLLLKLNSQFPFVGGSRYEVRDTSDRRDDGGAEKAEATAEAAQRAGCEQAHLG